jgi:hypothetical protein
MVDLTHYNTIKSSGTFYWSGTDREDLYSKNIQNPEIAEYFLNNGWVDETSIIYRYNSLGFRCDEFDQRESYIAIGCSFTEGVGLREDQTWAYQLSKLLGTHVWNLGVGGHGISSCFRILQGYIDRLNVKGVFLLAPPTDRLEYFVNGQWAVAMPLGHDGIPGYKEWVSSENNLQLELMKSIFAMKYLCLSRNIDFFKISHPPAVDRARDVNLDILFKSTFEVFVKNSDWRNYGHPGPKTNELFAAEFYKKFTNR